MIMVMGRTNMPHEYQLIPVHVTAIKLTPESAERAAAFCGGVLIEEIDPQDSKKRFVGINFPTLSGVKRATQGDYIVKDHTTGEISVMVAYEFERKYEPI